MHADDCASNRLLSLPILLPLLLAAGRIREALFDVGEGVEEVRADRAEHADDGDRHERGNQAVLDGRGPGLVAEKPAKGTHL